jgi:hypothetical protein
MHFEGEGIEKQMKKEILWNSACASKLNRAILVKNRLAQFKGTLA